MILTSDYFLELSAEPLNKGRVLWWACSFSLLAHLAIMLEFPDVVLLSNKPSETKVAPEPNTVRVRLQQTPVRPVEKVIEDKDQPPVLASVKPALQKVQHRQKALPVLPVVNPRKSTVSKRKITNTVKETPISHPAIPQPVVQEESLAIKSEPPVDSDISPVASQALMAAQNLYKQKLMKWLNQYKQYPKIAQKRGQEGIVLVKFTINQKGELLDYSIVKGSRYNMLNKASQKILEKASPMPEVPVQIREGKQTFTYTIPIEYKLP